MPRFGLRGFVVCWVATAILLSASRAAPPVPTMPKADIFSVEIVRKPLHTVSFAGAGLRPPHQPRDDGAQSEVVLVKWFAHSPGIPPGALVMLETVTDRQPTVKNYTSRLPPKAAGNQTTRFDIPQEESRAAGPISEWRVRVIWRGRILASRTSPGWKAARRSAS